MRGVRSPQARNNLAKMRVGDKVLFYHSQQELAVVGLMEVTRAAYPDPSSADPKWLTCNFAPVRTMPRPVTLTMIKSEPLLADLPLIRQPRLAVMPISKHDFQYILELPK